MTRGEDRGRHALLDALALYDEARLRTMPTEQLRAMLDALSDSPRDFAAWWAGHPSEDRRAVGAAFQLLALLTGRVARVLADRLARLEAHPRGSTRSDVRRVMLAFAVAYRDHLELTWADVLPLVNEVAPGEVLFGGARSLERAVSKEKVNPGFVQLVGWATRAMSRPPTDAEIEQFISEFFPPTSFPV